MPRIEQNPIRFNTVPHSEYKGQILRYGDLSKTLEHALKIYGTHDGVLFLLSKREEAINKIMVASGDRISGIFSTGYPNYIIPEIDLPTPRTALAKVAFVPVPEILEYVQKTQDKARDQDSQEYWPCISCYERLGLQSLRPTDHDCSSPITPFYVYSAIPDLDLCIVVDDLEQVPLIVKGYMDAGLNVAENQMFESIAEFPSVINIDPHFISLDQFEEAINRIGSDAENWFEVHIPVLRHHGNIVEHGAHIGLDFVSQLTPHIIQSEKLAKTFYKARNKFSMNLPIEKIIEQTKKTQARKDLPRKTGRFVSTFSDIEDKLRKRLKSYRTFGIEASTPDKGFVIIDDPNPVSLYELYDQISAYPNLVNVIDEGLLLFLSEYSPSFIQDLNRAIGSEYPYNSENISTDKAVRLAMAHTALDNILFEGNANPILLDDRLNRLREVMEYVRLPTQELEGYLQDSGSPHTYAETTYFAKRLTLNLYHYFSKTPEGNQVLSLSQNEYTFITAIKELFGDNLKNIILYGSSTNSRKGNDYDLLVIVDDISEQLYKDIENKQQSINSQSDRDVQMIIVPEKDLSGYLSVEGMPLGSTELIYGTELTIPVFSEDCIQRIAYQANRIVRSFTSMQMAFRDPEYYIQKPHVLRGHLKLSKYLIESYRILFSDTLPSSFFDQLHKEFPILEIETELSSEKVKALRSQTMYNLFKISKIVNQKIYETAKMANFL